MIHPAPKPAKRSPKQPSRPNPLSAKQRAKFTALGIHHPQSSIVPTRSSVKINRRKRKPSEYARIYGSRERVSWMKQQPCMGGQPHGCSGPIENAHVCDDGSKGMGRKSGYRTIAPLCRGHHRYLHRVGQHTYQAETGVSLAAIAAQTQQRWLLEAGRSGLHPESGRKL